MFNITKSVFVLFAVALLGFSGGSFAQSKVAVVNVEAAVYNTDIARKRIETLRSDTGIAELNAQIESLNKDLQQLQQQREKNELTWSDEEKAEFAKKYEYKMADRELTLKKIQSEDRAFQRKINEELGPKINEALESLAEEGGYDVILRADNRLLHVSEDHDLTAKLTDRINKMQ